MQHPPARHDAHPSTLAALLHEQARRQGDAPALLAPGRTALSYAELHALVVRLGQQLHALGATRHTRIAVLLPNGPEMAAAFLGVAAHAACAPLNPALQAEELRFHLQDTRADMLVLLRGAAGPAREVALALGLTLIEIEVDDAGPAGNFRVAGERPHAGLAHVAPAHGDVGRVPAPDDMALLLHTSGTTARSKLVPLSQANLMASAHNIAAHLRLTARDRCLNVMPLFHIHGLVGALLATLAGGGSIVCTPGFDDEAFFDWIARFDPSWTTAVPTIHQAVLAHGARYRQKAPSHRFRFVRSSSAALPAATLRALQALLQAPVVEAYGMTEASHQMASNPVQPGEQTAGCVGMAAGAQIAILDVAPEPTPGRPPRRRVRPLAAGQMGEVAVRGPGVMRGYENHPQANAEALQGGWFRTGDLGHLDAQGRLFIAGRLKEIVNRGGEKLSPREVDDALLEHPDVLQAAAFGVPHPSLGEDLAAAVVLRAGSAADEQALRAFLFARLAAFKVPSQIVRVHGIPTAATGKVQRASLHQALGAALARAFVAPGTERERAVESIMREVLDGEPLGAHDNFFARGGDSLRGARVIARVNARFGLNLPVTSLFRHPSVAELAALLQGPSSPGGEEAPDLPVLPRQRDGAVAGPISRSFSCSFSQEALWLVERLATGAGAYNSAQALRISGALDVAALNQALRALLQRHEVLRTGFEEVDGVPVQRVHADAALKLAEIDARDAVSSSRAPASGVESAPADHLATEAMRPFDLSRPPLLRATLWRCDATEGESEPQHVLLLVAHHIVADGWSMQVLMSDFGRLYSACLHAVAAVPPLPPLPLQFADWAAWQRDRLQGRRLEADLDHWRHRLAGLTPPALPTDRPRPSQPSHAGRSERFQVPAELAARLRALARERNVTLFMLLLAAFKVLLMRHCQQDDVAVGSPVAGRDRPELEGLVGHFVNTLVLRTDVSGNPGFVDLLQRVRQTALEAYDHQALPFERLVAELSPRRDLSRNPLFQVSFALNNQPAAVYALEGATVRPVPLPARTAKFDLSLTFTEAEAAREGAELQGQLEYSTDLFDRETVLRLSSHLQNLLAGIAADPHQRVTRLPMMSDAEWQCLDRWNQTALATPEPMVHQQVEQQARRTPEAVAVVFGQDRLSYRQLNARANQLAHHLRRHGVGPEVMVAVCLERSLDLVVAALAVPKAGGALVPLDPELPDERLAFMLQDTAAPYLLAESALTARLPQSAAGAARGVLCLDTQWDRVAAESEDDPAGAAVPGQLAYVIYTSGSTGKPKGVLLEHGGWRNHAHWLRRTLQVLPEDRFLQISSIGFDAAIVELYLPLLAGATLVVAAPGEHRDTAYLARLLQEQQITVLQMVPSALRSLLAEPLLRPGSLRCVVSGGEALDSRMAGELQRRLPRATLGNFYGPTETTIHSTHFELPPPIDPANVAGGQSEPSSDAARGGAIEPARRARGTVPIGRPIANTQCFVLDRELQPVPVGVVGELWIGGAGLARGYLDRPALTAERFIRLPSSGQRVYRSGDLVRLRADGNIEYLGRADFQVKIRGQRIELGEIEAALTGLPGVREGVVVVGEDAQGHARLVAYLAGSELIVADLKAALARRLPEAMVPSAFVVLEQLPTLSSGKVDRKALPATLPAADRALAVAPRTPTEKAVTRIWREVLGIEHVGVHDDFFDLGGHSLTAMQVVARLRAGLQLELPLRSMFKHPTLETLAAEIERTVADRRPGDASGGETALGALPGIPTMARGGPLMVSYSQRRMWLVQMLNPATSAYNMSLALRLRGPLNADALVTAIDWVVQRHEAFRTRFGAIDGEVMQWIDPPCPARIEHLDLRHRPAEECEHEALAQRERMARRPFDLSVSGLYRVSLLQMADAEHVLLWVKHHVIGDHWSDGILLREMGHAYGALMQGRQPALPPLEIDYADYAAWQRAPAQGRRLVPQMAYWADRLQGIRPLPLPYDLSWSELPSGRGSSVSARLAASTVEALRRLSSSQGATPFMTLLACFNVVLSHYSGETDIAVGSPVANRTRVESERLVGTLVNMLVMRSDLSGDPSFLDLLARVKGTALEAFANQDAPFERLVEELDFDRSSHRQPLFQVLFNVINTPFDVKAIEGLTLERFEYTSVAAQYELGLSVDDSFGNVQLSYSTDLFVRATATRVLASFLAVVDQVLANPQRRLSSFVLTGDEDRQALAHWNHTPLDLPDAAVVHTQLHHQAQRTPERAALRCGADLLSHAELQARALRLARALRSRGVARGCLVGLSLPRGVDMVVAQLAILHSGAAYVPLDPAYPPDRLAYMAQDAGLALVVGDSTLATALDWPAERTLRLDAEAAFIASHSGAALVPDETLDARPEDPAYVIYTSGSTGRPKGVVVPHRAVVNFLAGMVREPGLEASDVLVAVTTLSFDIAVLELLLPLFVGATVVLARREEAVDGRALRALIENSGATVMQATPSTWRLLIDAGWLGGAPFKALSGGEGLPVDLAQQLLARAELWNLYGPTETTVWSTCWRVTDPESGIRIGRPIANTQVHVLDSRGQPCPIGVAGEIFIGGCGVASGYLHRPELTAERFAADPFSPRAGARMYRSGDRGRWCHDGLLEHLGRLDFQVKVRGHRIELGEIEAALGTHAQVACAVVIVREDRPGDVRLVAYVVPKAEAPTAAALRDHLRTTLPEYMLPQHVVTIAAVPLLPNGKMDRRALPLPDLSADAGTGRTMAAHDLPQTTTEQAVAQVWQALLGAGPVTRTDNFFDLGGHSLLAMRAVSEMEQRCGLRIELRRLIHESLAQIAATPVTAADGAKPADPARSPARDPTPSGPEGGLKRVLRTVRERLGG